MFSPSRTDPLYVDWATAEAVAFACRRWHYSHVAPGFKAVRIGVWEHGKFIGVVLFGQGANNHLAGAYGLQMNEACELTRIALTQHAAPVTRIVRLAVQFLRRQCPGLRLIVSYADPLRGHHGGIYQGGNWLYLGRSGPQAELVVDGAPMHKRTAFQAYGTASVPVLRERTGRDWQHGDVQWKHTYLLPLDPVIRAQVLPAALPYPKPDTELEAIPLRVRKRQDAETNPSALGGSTPTRTLHDSEALP